MRRVWDRLGRVPAVWIVGGFFSGLVLSVAVLPGGAAIAAGLALFAVVCAYSLARPRGGWDVVAAAALPSAGWRLAHDLLGAPDWIVYALIPVALWLAWTVDGEDDQAPAFKRTGRARPRPRS
jgi:hypothetical protein